MIKKDIKKLTEFQNLGGEVKNVPRWRIHLEDGSFIDCEGTENRDRIIRELVLNGEIHYNRLLNGEIHYNRPVRMTNLTGTEYINHRINIEPTSRIKEKRTILGFLKERIGKWDWSKFYTNLLICTVISFLMGILTYLATPIKINDEKIGFLETVGIHFLCASITSTFFWLWTLIYKTITVVTVFIKLALFLAILLLSFPFNFISESFYDKTMNWIGDKLFTEGDDTIIEILRED